MLLGFVFVTNPADWHLAPRLVAQIEQHHPGSGILALTDGMLQDSLPGATLVCSADYLKRPATIAHYSHRKLALALEHLSDAEVLIQLDPDTCLQGPLPPLPDADWFGVCCADRDRRKYVHGACWGMRRGLAEQLVEANPFAPELYSGLRPDGSALEDKGFAEAVRLVYPADQWASWPGLSLMGQQQQAATVWHPRK